MKLNKIANFYLGAKYLTAPIHSEAELKHKTGVSLSELKHLWIFRSRNNFKSAVKELIHNNVKINFEKANKVKEGNNGNQNI